MLVFATAVTVALVVSFLCSIFESVLLSLGYAQVESLVREGKRSGRLLRDFKRHIDVPIAAILIVNTIAHTMGAAVAGASYEDVFSNRTLWLFSILFTAAVLLFTEIIPKTIGVTHAARLATPVAHGIKVLITILWPLVWLSEKISTSIRGASRLPVTSVEEIRLLAALGRAEGILGARTASIILGATRLGQLRAADVMLPRHSIVFLSGDSSREEILATMQESGFSRFPYSPTRSIDDTTGIVLARELLFFLQNHPQGPIDWSSLVREPLVIPDSRLASTLLRAFREARSHLALVVDEYGSMEGIVTLEDVLEEIVGDILDESDQPEPEIWRQPDGSIQVLASLDLRRLCEQLEIEWFPELAAASIGGFIAERLGRVPVVGDRVDWRGFELKVLSADPKRATRVAIKRKVAVGSHTPSRR